MDAVSFHIKVFQILLLEKLLESFIVGYIE